MPKISVLMGIYNCAATLPDAIECILAQTVTDWELILCEDGSADDTYAVAAEYAEKYPDQIILIKNEKNMGLNYTLNRCLAAARGEFVARMDGDDLCSPDRFEKELAALEANPDLSIVSCATSFFDDTGTWGKSHPVSFPQPLDFLKGTPFCHAPCLVRREAYEAVGGYTVDKKYLRVEDFELWVKMYAMGYRGMNIQEILYHVRDDREAKRRRKLKYRINEARVLAKATRLLKLPLLGYCYSIRPILVGLLPAVLYDALHKSRLTKEENVG